MLAGETVHVAAGTYNELVSVTKGLVFEGANAGLVVAEVELDHAVQRVDLPPWVGAEVSGDPRYLNTSLALHPYTRW